MASKSSASVDDPVSRSYEHVEAIATAKNIVLHRGLLAGGICGLVSWACVSSLPFSSGTKKYRADERKSDLSYRLSQDPLSTQLPHQSQGSAGLVPVDLTGESSPLDGPGHTNGDETEQEDLPEETKVP